MKNYYWFIFVTVWFLADSFAGHLYLLRFNPVTDDNLLLAAKLYTAIKGCIAAAFYSLFWIIPRHSYKFDRWDNTLVALCMTMSFISSSKAFFGQEHFSPALLWVMFGLFYSIIAALKIGTYRR